MTRLTTLNLPDFYKTTIGFDSMFDEMANAFATNTGGYPPYNIVKESDSSYTISLAVAGFDKDEIKIQQDGNALSINAEKKESDEKIEYLHKGIGTRNFTKEFSKLWLELSLVLVFILLFFKYVSFEVFSKLISISENSKLSILVMYSS